MEIKRIFDIPKYQLYKNALNESISSKFNDKWISLSTVQYIEKINSLSRAILSLGDIRGEKVILISDNRLEWVVTDLAIQQLGGIVVPMYPTVSNDTFKYIFNHSEATICFVSNKEIYDKVNKIKDSLPNLKKVYSFEEIEDVISWNRLIEIGEENKHLQEKVEEISNSITEDDLVSIIYTSGTTGEPKGVMINHKNITKGIQKGMTFVNIDSGKRVLSFLPMSHILERVVVYIYQIYGCSIYFSGIDNISEDMKHIKPYFLTAVPRLLEKIYDKIYAKGKELSIIKKLLFFWSINVGKKFKPFNENGIFYDIKLWIARKLIFKKWKEALGGNIETIVSGGAALQERLTRIFSAAGIKIVEAYGLTETCAVGTINSNFSKDYKIGTVGKPICDDLKITDDGEILIKGISVMQGYYKDEQKTNEVLKDGYFYTGDIGELDSDGFLKITDRKKEMFKTSGGKYVSPQFIENLLKESFFIEQAMVVGDGYKFPSALIKLDFDFVKKWAEFKNIVITSYEDFKSNNNVVYQRILKELQKTNEFLGDWEKIKEFRIINEIWSIETGELTPTLKLRRKIIMEKYNALIQSIYA